MCEYKKHDHRCGNNSDERNICRKRKKVYQNASFEHVLQNKKSSISAWCVEAMREIKKVEEEEIFKELF